MKNQEFWLYRLPGVRRRFSRSVLLGSLLSVATLGTATSAFGSTITDGTSISETVYNSGMPVSYNAPPSYNYTNGIASQTNAVTQYAGTATSTASLTSDQLSLSLSGSGAFTSAVAEMWDTLSFGNLPTGPTVTANTVLGTLTMSVTGSIGTATYGAVGYASYGLSLFNPTTFAPSLPGGGCEVSVDALSCGGLIGSSGKGWNIFTPGTNTFSVPFTIGDLSGSNLAYIAAISATNYSDPSLTSPLVIDPTVSLNGLYSGVTVTSLSGYGYTGASPTTVPEPGTLPLMGLAVMASAAAWGRARQARHDPPG